MSRTSISDVPTERRCNAKTRAGTPCRNWSILPAGRCRMHGGKSFRGVASPQYRHGWYSEDAFCKALWSAALKGKPWAQSCIKTLAGWSDS